jgi:hypothetical protein
MAARVPTRQNLFGFGRPAPVAAPVRRKGRTGGLSLSEASSAAMKAGRKAGDLSDFDSWLERKHLDTRSDGVISRIRDSYKRGIDKAEADEQNREFLKQKHEQSRELARDRRDQARDARASGGRKTKVAAESSGYASAPDEETIQRGFKQGKTLSEILRGNPALRKRWKKRNPAAASALEFVSMDGRSPRYPKGGEVHFWMGDDFYIADLKSAEFDQTKDAGALSSALVARLRKSHRLHKQQRGTPYRVTGNPAAASAEVFEEFHGFKPSETITVTKKIHYHKHLAAAGKLTHLDVWGIDGTGHKISGFKGAFLAFNESKNQLFVEGGDQRVNLEDFGIDPPHELETLGRLTDIGYQTNKTHLGDEGGEAVYVHKFRAVNRNGKHVIVKIARYPDLIYDVRNEQLLFSGGSYEILREGINQ